METRNTLRVPVDFEAVWKIDRAMNQFFSLVGKNGYRVKVFNISANGMGIFSKHFLPSGLRIKIAFLGKMIGLNKFVKVKGEVRYCNFIKHEQYKCGIKFIGIPEFYTSKFNEFIINFEKRQQPREFLSE